MGIYNRRYSQGVEAGGMCNSPNRQALYPESQQTYPPGLSLGTGAEH